MKSAKLLKGWRMHSRCGMVAAFLCIPALPASPAVGWESPPGMAHRLLYTTELLPGISCPLLETGVCGGAWLDVISGSWNQKAGERLFLHLGVDGASVNFLACFSFKCEDICPGHRVETRPCLLVLGPVSSRAAALQLLFPKVSKSEGGGDSWCSHAM